MRRLMVALCLLATACSDGGDETGPGPVRDLTQLVAKEAKAAYHATYAWTYDAPNAVQATIEVTQRPPDHLRRIETGFKAPDGKTRPVSYWSAMLDGEHYDCNAYGDDVGCLRTEPSASIYGFSQLDDAVHDIADPDRLAKVRRVAGATIGGEKASCWRAEPKAPPATPKPSPRPRYEPGVYRYEACFTSDGIPLRLRRVPTTSPPPGISGAAGTLEVTGLDRTPGKIQLPGEVRKASELVPTPSPTPAT